MCSDIVKLRRRGFARERDLVRKLWEAGFACVRGPASGAKARRIFYPDVVAIRNGRVYVFEVKTRRKLETIYIDRRKLLNLIDFARRAGGRAFIAVKIVDGASDWRFIPIEKLEKTSSGMFRVTPEIYRHHGLRISDLIADATGQRRLIDF